MFQFSYWFLFPLLSLPLFLKKRSVEVSSIKLYSKVGYRAHIGDAFYTVAFILSIFALMRPQEINRGNIDSQGINIALLLDLSGSMATEDIYPNRVEAAKSVIVNFIKKRERDKIGLILFAEHALPKVPLTLDHRVLLDKIDEIEIGDIPEKGTSIGRGLAFAISMLKRVEKSKIVVLLTDGNETESISLLKQSATLAAKMDIKIYTIGIKGLQRDIFGGVFQTGSVDDSILKGISSTTGGRYYSAASESDLNRIFSEIDKIERVDLQKPYFEIVELYRYFLIPALILTILGAIFNEVLWTQIW